MQRESWLVKDACMMSQGLGPGPGFGLRRPLSLPPGKVVDDADEYASGFCALQVLDQDGLARKRCGSRVEAPWHFSAASAASGEDLVRFEASFAPNPLFSVTVSDEAGYYLIANWWVGANAPGRTNHLCNMTPMACEEIVRDAEDDGSSSTTHTIEAVGMVPFAGATSSHLPVIAAGKSCNVRIQILLGRERLARTRVASILMEMPRSRWMEWKAYRLGLWQSSKTWPEEGQVSTNKAGSSAVGVGAPGDDANDWAGDSGLASSSYDDSGPPPPCVLL